MSYPQPESMDECVYFTQRGLFDEGEEKGEIMAWVFKGDCPKCGEAKMGKPTDDSGKVKIRAKEYVCPKCKHTVEKQEYEDTLVAFCTYTCPKCSDEGEAETPYKRKNIEGVQTLRFKCKKCDANLDVTKKMKEKKAKKAAADF